MATGLWGLSPHPLDPPHPGGHRRNKAKAKAARAARKRNR